MIRHALVQFKPHKSQLSQNLERLSKVIAQLGGEGIDVLTLPETALTGYFLQAGVREQALTAGELLELLQGRYNRRAEPPRSTSASVFTNVTAVIFLTAPCTPN